MKCGFPKEKCPRLSVNVGGQYQTSNLGVGVRIPPSAPITAVIFNAFNNRGHGLKLGWGRTGDAHYIPWALR
jgi:hypothetical protein